MQDKMMTKSLQGLLASCAAVLIVASLSAPVQAVERISVNVVNDRDFKLSIELADKVCGGNVLLRDQLEAGEIREIEICANADGVGALRASYGSGCSQVKRTEFLGVSAGDSITF